MKTAWKEARFFQNCPLENCFGLFGLFLLSVLTAALLIPFADKAFHIDDPLFIWAAERIHLHPGDPYGFKLNWYGEKMRAWEVIQNPPLAAYFISFAAHFLGFGEKALHLIFILPSLGVVLGTYYLARRVCSKPFLAGALVLAMPVFLVSSTSVMCDITMLAFFVWAVALWDRGLVKNENLSLLTASFLAGLCALTKYYGIVLIPMLALYTVLRKRTEACSAMVYLLIPVALLMGYHLKTTKIYGGSLLYNAAGYTHFNRRYYGFEVLERYLTGLSFLGGCLITVLFVARHLLNKDDLAASFRIFFLTLVSVFCIKTAGLYSFDSFLNLGQPQVFQFLIFVFTGILVLLISSKAAWSNRRDPFLVLLNVWIVITFAFAAFFNWSINGRSLLPLVPPVCILAARQIEDFTASGKTRSKLPLLVLCGILFSFVLALADRRFADTGRDAAGAIYRKHHPYTGNVLFQGHWGFQYYMEKNGFKAMDKNDKTPADGEIVVIPGNNTNRFPLPPDTFALCDKMEFNSFPWVTTMHHGVGAGFYSDIWGPLPFAIGTIPPESYYLYCL
ncbi:MAG: glycosyltransferase family 39 protein [Candidatus Omnitrophica bacterium]|nr:glycosyltransferase family 39 protein [Candidatus Omnitrophota bacterium]